MISETQAVVRDLEDRGFDYAYALTIATIRERERRAREGRVVIRGRDCVAASPVQGHSLSRQYLGYHLLDTATRDWRVFVQDVDQELSGHIHQGGLAIFILEGKGATIIDDVRYDWEAGDLLLIPVKSGGVFHRHLNSGARARWIAFWYDPALAALATTLVHPSRENGKADGPYMSEAKISNE